MPNIMSIVKKKGLTQAQADARYLKLDQSTKQTVVNGAPQFNKGIIITESERVILNG